MWKFIFNFNVKAEINQKKSKEAERILKKQNEKVASFDESRDQFIDSILNISAQTQKKSEGGNKSNEEKKFLSHEDDEYNAAEELDRNVEKLKQLQNYMNFKE